MQPHRLGFISAASIVVANMIGTGVFTSLGYQVQDIQSVFALLMLWVTGGVLALCGAMTYAELGSRFPASGGEYHLLTHVYHPLPGFLSGWVSAVAGFAAPTALAAIAFGKYLHAVYPLLSEKALALALVIVFTAMHSFSVRLGTRFQDSFTMLKVLVIAAFVLLVLFAPNHQPISIVPQASDLQAVFQPSFALNLIYVSFAYTGWNAAIYVVGEINDPHRNVPRALIVGTVMVTVLYALLNYSFLLAAPQGAIAGKVEIGHIASAYIFGDDVGNVISIVIALLMISTVSVMIFIGPRVIHRMGEDFSSLSYFNKKSSRHVPVQAVLLQGLITVVFIVTSTFDQVLLYAAFSLILVTMMTVFAIFVARRKWPDQRPVFKMRAYPVAPAFFLVVNAFIVVYIFADKPQESMVGLGIVLLGIPFYYLAK